MKLITETSFALWFRIYITIPQKSEKANVMNESWQLMNSKAVTKKSCPLLICRCFMYRCQFFDLSYISNFRPKNFTNVGVTFTIRTCHCEVWGSTCSQYQYYGLLEYEVLYFDIWLPKFCRNMLIVLPSWYKSDYILKAKKIGYFETLISSKLFGFQKTQYTITENLLFNNAFSSTYFSHNR